MRRLPVSPHSIIDGFRSVPALAQHRAEPSQSPDLRP
jgi:hypothetical protein